MIDFATLNVSKEDSVKIAKIVKRYAARLGGRVDVLARVMDLEVVHDRIGLDLDGLLAADSFNLCHDVQGIAGHLDRDTGELGGCFVPRFAK